MSCENCLGILTVAIASVIVGIILMRKYSESKNRFTLYMALYFIINSIGYFIWFITTEWVLNIEATVSILLIFISIIPQLILLVFILTFYEVSIGVRSVVVAACLTLTMLYAIWPSFLFVYIIVSMLIVIANFSLFLRNWRKNNDIKSLGFAIGLIFLFFGGTLSTMDKLISGIFYIIASVIWVITYSGLIDKND